MADSQVLKPRLPVEYQEVEYIESNGTEYIDTGIIPKIGDIYQVTYMEFSGLTNYVVFGERTSGTYATSTNQVYYSLSSSGTPKITYMFSGTHQEVVAKREINAKLSYTVTVLSNYDNAATEPMYIFALNNQGVAAAHAIIRVYEFKVNRNSAVIQHLIPCYRKSDNVIGLYDIVSGNFLINNGTGDLSKGADKSTGTWLHSLRKLTTATEAVENPLYSDGTAITAYTLKGNTVQNGTPTPSNPVDVNGVGVRTENLFDGTLEQGGLNGGDGTEFDSDYRVRSSMLILNAGTYTISISSLLNMGVFVYNGSTFEQFITYASSPITFTLNATKNIRIGFTAVGGSTAITPIDVTNLMLNTGSTAKPFEPNGYKIPISSGGVTTNIYLGSTQTVRQIKKLVLTGEEEWQNSFGASLFGTRLDSATIAGVLSLSTNYIYNPIQSGLNAGLANGEFALQVSSPPTALYIKDERYTTVDAWKSWLATQYANGTPVTVWYVLATPETAAVNEPLMKIGTYADTLSNAAQIPTTDGANSITVDTTVQPSEFTATWTGWHDSSVKEWDGTNWN